MERRKFELGYYWDFITSFNIYTNHPFDEKKLTEELKRRLTGIHFRDSIKVKLYGSARGLYTVSFAHTKDEDIKEKAQSLLDGLKEIESELETAQGMDRVKGLLK